MFSIQDQIVIAFACVALSHLVAFELFNGIAAFRWARRYVDQQFTDMSEDDKRELRRYHAMRRLEWGSLLLHVVWAARQERKPTIDWRPAFYAGLAVTTALVVIAKVPTAVAFCSGVTVSTAFFAGMCRSTFWRWFSARSNQTLRDLDLIPDSH